MNFEPAADKPNFFQKIWRSLTIIAFVGFLFDMGNLCLSLVDAYSDLSVALEFRDVGRTGFFYACIVVFVLGMISDAIAFVIAYDSGSKSSRLAGWQMVVGTIVLTPFAHVLPLVNFLMASFDDDFNDFTKYQKTEWDKEPEDWYVKNYDLYTFDDTAGKSPTPTMTGSMNAAPNSSSKATEEVMSKYKMSNESVVAQIDRAALQRQRTMMVINVQCLVESLPQSIIQLIAISLTEKPTQTQIFSLSLSLFSIATKAFQLCRSWKIEAFFGKLLFFIHDLFSLAFLSSAVFLSSVPAETTFFFGLFEVTHLTWWWLFVKVITIIVGIACIVLILVEDMTRYTRSRQELMNQIGVFTTFFIIGFIPVVIVQEGMKFSYLYLLSKLREPSPRYCSILPYIHHFLWDKQDVEDHDKTKPKNNNNIQTQVEQKTPFFETTDWKATFRNLKNDMDTLVAARTNDGRAYLSHRNCYPRSIRRTNEQALQHCRVVGLDSENPSLEDEHTNNNNNNSNNNAVQEYDGFLTRAKYCLAAGKFIQMKEIVEYDYYSSNAQVQGYLDQRNDLINKTCRNTLFASGSFSWLRFIQVFLPTELLPEDFDLEKLLKFNMSFAEIKELVATSVKKVTVDTTQPQANNNHNHFWSAFCAFVVIPFFCALSGITGLIFPVLHYFWYSEKYWTAMQHITFWPAVSAFILVIPLLPACLRYVLTSMVTDEAHLYYRERLVAIIDTYRSVPVAAVRIAAIPDSRVIPERCVNEHVLVFLDPKMVDLHGLGGNEYRDLMKMLKK